MKAIAPVVFGTVVLVASSIYGQHMPEDMPKWKRGEFLTDRQKLEQIERKASYEQKRAQDFASRGITRYEPTPESLAIRLPDTVDDGINRLNQLNRITRAASRAGRPWIQYEFKVVTAHTKLLIDRRQ